jgi:glycosyltransferase involved in cell wall biosynthesis
VTPSLTILIPSFRDPRILATIRSVRHFDDVDAVRVLIIDGGSPPELVDAIREALIPGDVLVSERDKGIFDGLNKGLARIDTPYMGWLGSDDLFTGEVMASEVLAALANADLFIHSVAFVDDRHVRRITHSAPSARGMMRFGLHNPHYGTFGHTRLLQSEQFDISDTAADIDYFLRIWNRKPAIVHSKRIGTLMGEGGFSNGSAQRILQNNRSVYTAYGRYYGLLTPPVAVATKLLYKVIGRAVHSTSRIDWRRRFPTAARLSITDSPTAGSQDVPSVQV